MKGNASVGLAESSQNAKMSEVKVTEQAAQIHWMEAMETGKLKNQNHCRRT